jgi:hypothetical protein
MGGLLGLIRHDNLGVVQEFLLVPEESAGVEGVRPRGLDAIAVDGGGTIGLESDVGVVEAALFIQLGRS